MPMQEPFIYFFNNRYFLLASLVGFEPARQRYIASQKPNTLPTELSGRPNIPYLGFEGRILFLIVPVPAHGLTVTCNFG